MGIYDFNVIDNEKNTINLGIYKGKVLLIVNTATSCAFTSQYTGLQNIYDKYKSRGLEVLDFPCNQFMKQADGTDKEINSFCTLNYKTTFKRFKKVDVNGNNEDKLFAYLKAKTKGLFGDDIKWNFTKFLVDKNGYVVGRFSPHTSPAKIEKIIEKYLD